MDPAQPKRACFLPDRRWPDDRGIHLNAHGGGVLFHEGLYYLYGEHKIGGEAGNQAHVGVHVYASRDLYNWEDRGIALSVTDDPGSDIAIACVLERPKVLYNARTKRFVMWFHLELKGQGYLAARVGVAVATRPEGPFVFHRSFRINAGHWPVNVTEAQKASLREGEKLIGQKVDGDRERLTQLPLLARDFAGGQMARDMTLFLDDDGVAYHLCASEENSTLHISRLTDDFLGMSGTWARVLEYRWNEAPAVCRHQGRYYLLSSDCTGWAPNAARLAVADHLFGPWRELGNPCVGVNPHNAMGPEKTFGGQSTFILPVAGRPGKFIAMFDVWRPKDAITGGYVWLPITFTHGGLELRWKDEWNLDSW